MRKSFIFILALVLALLAFTGCGDNFNYGPIAFDQTSASAPVQNNGGPATVQGNYLYFINGVGSTTADNKFGEVTRGALMRYTLNSDGSIVDDSLVTVVPKVIYSTYGYYGYGIFGEWIYYVTPSVKIDKQGNRLTDIIEFYRVKHDGTGTTKLFEITGANTPYVFTEKAIVYYLEGTIYSVNVTGTEFTPTALVEEATGYMFPNIQDYDPADTTLSASEYIYYTVADEDDHESANHLYAISPDGSTKVNLINPDTYTEDDNDYRNRVTITPVKVEGNVLYYNKTYNESNSAISSGLYAGLYGYDLGGAPSAEITPANEFKVGVTSYSAVYRVTNNVVLASNGSEMKLLNFGGADKINEVTAFSSDIFVLEIRNVVSSETALSFTALFQRDSGENLFTYDFSFTLTDGIYELDNENVSQAQTLTDVTASVNYLQADIVGDYMYYENEYGYISRVKIGDLDSEPEMLGKMTAADQEIYDKAQEENN